MSNQYGSFTVAMTMLCTVAEFRRFAHVEGAGFDHLDPVLLDLIVGNTRRVWKRLGGDKSMRYVSEYFDIEERSQDYVMASLNPVQAVAAITVVTPGISSGVVVAAGDIWFDGERIGVAGGFGEVGQIYQDQQPPLGVNRNRAHIHYQGGYSTDDLFPLKLAVFAETAAWLNRSGYEGIAGSSEDKISYSFEKSGWCSQANAILRSWGT